MTRLGYCCINLTLQKKKITYSRDMQQATFNARGLSYASELALQNSEDLIKVLRWNVENNVEVFRIGSGIFPWSNKYKLSQLPDFARISRNLEVAGDIINASNMRVTSHPDHFVKLASLRPDVVDSSIQELEHHSEVFDLMNLPKNPTAAINIHVGMNFSKETADRWCTAALRLSQSAFSRLVVENDDKETGFSVCDLVTYIHSQIGTPVTFDYFHHEFHTSGLDAHDAFHMAYATWPDTPLFHYSESKKIHEGINCNPRAHSDYALSKIDTFNCDVDIDLEVKMKELALFKYRELYGTKP